MGGVGQQDGRRACNSLRLRYSPLSAQLLDLHSPFNVSLLFRHFLSILRLLSWLFWWFLLTPLLQIREMYEKMRAEHAQLQKSITALEGIEEWRQEVAQLEQVRGG